MPKIIEEQKWQFKKLQCEYILEVRKELKCFDINEDTLKDKYNIDICHDFQFKNEIFKLLTHL